MKPHPSYRPLAVQQQEIRLITLQPLSGRDDEKISCSIQHVSLRQASPFCALSYVWGPAETATEYIILDGIPMTVRQNLYSCLKRLRLWQSQGARFWIDSICIHQEDISERSAQLSLMGQIYGSADPVCAWLGESSPGSYIVFDHAENTMGLSHAGMPYRDFRKNNVEHVLDVIEREYWSRLWVIQQFILASNLRLFCGAKSVEWADLHKLMAIETGTANDSVAAEPSATVQLGTPLDLIPPTESYRVLNRLMLTKELRGSGFSGDASLHSLVLQFQAYRCQDTRDKIYGLLALAKDGHQVTVDYSKPVLQVLLETAPVWARRSYTRNLMPAFDAAEFLWCIDTMISDHDLDDFISNPIYHSRTTQEVVLELKIDNRIREFYLKSEEQDEHSQVIYTYENMHPLRECKETLNYVLRLPMKLHYSIHIARVYETCFFIKHTSHTTQRTSNIQPNCPAETSAPSPYHITHTATEIPTSWTSPSKSSYDIPLPLVLSCPPITLSAAKYDVLTFCYDGAYSSFVRSGPGNSVLIRFNASAIVELLKNRRRFYQEFSTLRQDLKDKSIEQVESEGQWEDISDENGAEPDRWERAENEAVSYIRNRTFG